MKKAAAEKSPATSTRLGPQRGRAKANAALVPLDRRRRGSAEDARCGRASRDRRRPRRRRRQRVPRRAAPTSLGPTATSRMKRRVSICGVPRNASGSRPPRRLDLRAEGAQLRRDRLHRPPPQRLVAIETRSQCRLRRTLPAASGRSIRSSCSRGCRAADASCGRRQITVSSPLGFDANAERRQARRAWRARRARG